MGNKAKKTKLTNMVKKERREEEQKAKLNRST